VGEGGEVGLDGGGLPVGEEEADGAGEEGGELVDAVCLGLLGG